MGHDFNRFQQLILGGGEPRGAEFTGTKALMMAVLVDGIDDYCGAAGHRLAEAEAWVRSNRRGAFSFAALCETFGLEPTAVRQALVRFKNQSARPPLRVRPNPSKSTVAPAAGDGGARPTS